MSELDRKKAWDDFIALLRQYRFDDEYREYLAAAYEHYLASLKRDGFSTEDTMVILTREGPVIIKNSDIPQKLRQDPRFLDLIRHIWGEVKL